MALNPSRSHEELLTLARKVEAAATDHDRGRVEASSLRLFEALVDHIGVERSEFLRIPPGESRLLARGQQRVINRLIDVALAAQSPGPCRCADGAAGLVAELAVQAADERLALAHLPALSAS